MKEVITIIIPVYNGEKYLHRCLESVINQTYRELEIIIVDDGSTDSSLEICEEYQRKDQRIQIIKQDNAGVSSARNRALESVKTEWILFMDADDELTEDTVEIYQKVIMDEPDIDFIAGGIEKISFRRTVSYSFHIMPLYEDKGKNLAVNVLNNLPNGTVWGKLFRSNIIRENKLRFDEDLTHGEDCLFVYQYLMHSLCPHTMDKIIYRYYVHDSSVTKRFNEELPKAYISALTRLGEMINRDNLIECQAYYRCCLLHLLLITVNYSFHKNNTKGFIKEIKEYKDLIEMPMFRDALSEEVMENIGMSKRIVLCMIKKRFYLAVFMCARLRQIFR